MKYTIFICILLILFVSVNAYKLNCNTNQIAQYKYKSIVKAFGDEKRGEKFIIRAKVNLECVEAVQRKDGRDIMNYIMTIPKASMVVKNTTKLEQRKKDTIKKHVKGKSGDISGYFKKPIHMIITSNGKVEGVVYEQDEPQWVSNMKKTIINKIQTKFTSDHRKEKDANGEHEVHYKKKYNKAKHQLTIQKTYTDEDLGRHRFEPGHSHLKMDKQMVMDSNTKTIVDTRTGQIIEILAESHYDLGAQREPEEHGLFHDNQNVPFTDTFGTHDAFKMQHKTSLKLIRNKLRRRKHKRFGVQLMEDLSWKVAPTYKRDSSIEKLPKIKNAFKISKKQAKAFIKTLDHQKMTALDVHKMKRIFIKYPSLAKRVLNIISTDSSENGAALKRYILVHLKKYMTMLKEKDSAKLNDNIIALLSASKFARKKILEKLKDLSENHEDQQVRNNAYLVFADGVERLKNKALIKKYGRYLIDRFMSNDETQLNIHALENAGMAIDQSYIEKLIASKSLPKKWREAAIATLRKRTDGHRIVNKVLLNTRRYSKDDRTNMLQVLAKRHPSTDPAELDGVLAILMSNPKVDPLVKNLAYKFIARRRKQHHMYHLASDAYATFSLKKMVNDVKRCYRRIKEKLRNLSDDDYVIPDRHHILRKLKVNKKKRDFLRNREMTDFSFRRTVRRIGRAVRRTVRRVGGAVRRVVRTVSEVATRSIRKVNDFKKSITSMFSKATFRNNQVCIQASRSSSDRMCIYDAKLISFVNQQGSLSGMAYARHRVWETLVGSNKVHLYLGVASYMGTNVDCSGNDFRFALFAKGLARVTAFTKEIEILDGHIYVRKNPSLGNEIFLRVFNSVVYRNTPIPNNVQTCKDFSKNLLNKRYDNLPGYKIRIMIGPIPVSFGFSITSGVRVDAGAGYCLNRLSVHASLTSTVDLGIIASANIDIVILSAGIEVQGGFEYSLIPKAEIVGVSCKACIKLDSVSRYSLGINAAASVNIVVYKKKWSWNLFTLSSPRKTSTLASKCVSLPRGRTLGDVADNNLITSSSSE